MNIAEIEDNILRRLTATETGQCKLIARRAKMSKLSKVDLKAKVLPAKALDGAWLSTTQTDAARGKGIARVQKHGCEIAHIEVADGKAFFVPKPCYVATPAKWAVGLGGGDSAQITHFISACGANLQSGPNEREIQWQLAHALCKRSKSENDPLRGYRAVRWNDLFAEVGVSVKAKDNAHAGSTGTIDLMVRQKGGCFLVFELKKPGVTDVKSAFTQAIRYATALLVEANETPETRAVYRKIFGASSDALLRIGAVLVLENRKDIASAVEALWPCLVQSDRKVLLDRIGVLVYDYDHRHGLATRWHWLKEPQRIHQAGCGTATA